MINTTELTFEELIAKSGDAFLQEYHYSEGFLSLVIEYDDDDTEVQFQIKTDFVKFNVKNEINPITRTCRLEITDLAKNLTIKNGYYVAANDFAKFMNETRKGLNLAYGKKAEDTHFIFSVIGYEPLIICTSNHLTDINFSLKN